MLATIDQLTGLPNRRHFFDTVEAAITKGRTGVLLMADVDCFKKINDTYGHPAGDKCLKSFADLVECQAAAGCAVARMGGEEFAVFLPEATRGQARVVAQQLVEGVRFQPVILGGGTAEPVDVTMSVGAAQANGAVSFEELLRQSDAALYAAKDQGRARAVFHGDQDCRAAGAA